MKTLRNILLALSILIGIGGAVAAPMPDPAADSRVAAQLQSSPSIKVVGQNIEISLPGDEARQVVVYAITGQVVKTLTVHPGVTTIELRAGYYIIKCDRLSQRVVIR